MIKLLDCTLRDGGYVNDWIFGAETIEGIGNAAADTGVDIFEVSFLRDEEWKEDRCVHNDTKVMFSQFKKAKGVKYAGMIETGCLIPQDKIPDRQDGTLDMIRFVMWKNKMDLAYEYCKELKNKGYELCIQPTRVTQYSLEEFADMCKLMSELEPEAVYIVDTFGMLSSKALMDYVKVADENLPSKVGVGYHAHNNLMQAVANAEVFLQYNMDRDKYIDASVLGIGRGAGNLPLEVICKYLNENYGTTYNIAEILKLADKYVAPIKQNFGWGYNQWFYVTAMYNANPNYAIEFARREGVSIDMFTSILEKMDEMEKIRYMESTVDKYLSGVVL